MSTEFESVAGLPPGELQRVADCIDAYYGGPRTAEADALALASHALLLPILQGMNKVQSADDIEVTKHHLIKIAEAMETYGLYKQKELVESYDDPNRPIYVEPPAAREMAKSMVVVLRAMTSHLSPTSSAKTEEGAGRRRRWTRGRR